MAQRWYVEPQQIRDDQTVLLQNEINGLVSYVRQFSAFTKLALFSPQ